MEYRIRTAVPADEARIRELFLEMMRTIYHKKANDILPITSLQLRLKTLISSRFQASSFD